MAQRSRKHTTCRQLADGSLRLQAFAVTEPGAGTDTTRIETAATRDGDHYVITGRKIFISRVQHSDLMVLLARTSPRDESRPTAGLSLFLIDLRQAGDHIKLRRLPMMMNNETNEVTIDALRVPADTSSAPKGRDSGRSSMDGTRNGFSSRLSASATVAGSSSGRQGTRRRARSSAAPSAPTRGFSFPLASAWAQVEAADLVARRAAARFDAGLPCGAEANTAKLLASEASWAAANAAVDTLGGHGFNAERDVERKFRETRLYRVAPVSNNLV